MTDADITMAAAKQRDEGESQEEGLSDLSSGVAVQCVETLLDCMSHWGFEQAQERLKLL
jgi:hypothetical protein